MELLQVMEWKGNVRELEQILTRQALMEEKPILEGPAFKEGNSSPAPNPKSIKSQKAQQALVDAGYNKTRAASILRISRKTLYIWLREG